MGSNNLLEDPEDPCKMTRLLKSIMSFVEVGTVPPKSSYWTIFKVPARLKTNKDVYAPHIISIGPFHATDDHCKAMEEHKRLYMRTLLNQTPDSKETIANCSKIIHGLTEKASRCYEHINVTDQEKLALILVVDGCFMLELFRRHSCKELRVRDDPIFEHAWMISAIRRDLALLENQIPFFILEQLFELTVKRIEARHPPPSLTEYALSFFKKTLNLSEKAVKERSKLSGTSHLLELLDKCFRPSLPRTNPKGESLEFIHCATKLRDVAGIRFRKAKSENIMDIKFASGFLEIPKLNIQDSTEPLFRNLIAFEQCCRQSTQHVTSYCILMDCLIDTWRDSELLAQENIIANRLGRGGDVAELFNNICKEAALRDFCFARLCEEVNEYYNKPIVRHLALLKRDYCPNPCRTVSFTAASLLLCVSIVQFVYLILRYYRPLS